MTAPTVRMATKGTTQEQRALKRNYPTPPALLVSYVYLAPFLKHRENYGYRDWALDSGAYSAHNSGLEIKLDKYIDTVKELRDQDTRLTEVFALDVIGDWRASLWNCEQMWRQGIEAIPCYHPGRDEPESVLVGLARDYPKVAVGGLVNVHIKKKTHIMGQCFQRVWPARIHGFGMCGEPMVMGLPFHSVDGSNWENEPSAFGVWKQFGNMSIRGCNQDLRCQVIWHLDLERKARQKWAPLMDRHGFGDGAPVIRLAVINDTARTVEALCKR